MANETTMLSRLMTGAKSVNIPASLYDKLLGMGTTLSGGFSDQNALTDDIKIASALIYYMSGNKETNIFDTMDRLKQQHNIAEGNIKKMKVSQLKNLVREVIELCISEKVKLGEKKWISTAIDPSHKGYCTPMTKSTCTSKRKAFAMRAKHHDLEETAPPGFGPGKEHEDIYNKLKKQYGDDKKAYATMWKIHKKIDEAKKQALAEYGLK